MQATAKMRRTSPGQIKRAVIAFAIAAGLIATVSAATVIRDGRSGDSDRVAVGTGAATVRTSAFDHHFMEMNLELPTGSNTSINESMEPMFLQPNLDPSAGYSETARVHDFRFLEMNLDLPGSSLNAATDWRIIEQNRWGENFTFESPASPNGSAYPDINDVPQPRAGVVMY